MLGKLRLMNKKVVLKSKVRMLVCNFYKEISRTNECKLEQIYLEIHIPSVPAAFIAF
jgi:hypothetical protein